MLGLGGHCVRVLLLVLAGIVAWVLNTEVGTRFAAARAVGFLDGKLEIREVRGTIAGPLTVNGVRYHDPEGGVDVRVARVSVDVALRELLSRRAHVLFARRERRGRAALGADEEGRGTEQRSR